MHLVFDRTNFVYIMTHKGFEKENLPNGHIGLFLLDENNRRTVIRTAVQMGGHGREIGAPYIRQMAKRLHITPKDLNLYQACKRQHPWLLEEERKKGYIPPRDANTSQRFF